MHSGNVAHDRRFSSARLPETLRKTADVFPQDCLQYAAPFESRLQPADRNGRRKPPRQLYLRNGSCRTYKYSHFKPFRQIKAENAGLFRPTISAFRIPDLQSRRKTSFRFCLNSYGSGITAFRHASAFNVRG